MKKVLACLLSAVLTIAVGTSLVGCGSKAGEGTATEYPVFSTEKTFMIGGWDVATANENDYKTAKDMGLDFVFFGMYSAMGTDVYKNLLEYMDSIGLKAILQTGSSADDNSKKDFDQETDYSQYPAVWAINYWDEPNKTTMEYVKEYGDWHKGFYKDKDVSFFANLFPYTDKTNYESYADYVKAYCDIMESVGGHKMLSVDIYPLNQSPEGSIISTSWLTNLEDIAQAGKAYDVDTLHSFILSTQHGSYRTPTEADFRYQIWVDMAYGFNSISYFTYRTGASITNWGEALVDIQGNPNNSYYWAQKVNSEIHAIDDLYLSYDWNGMYPVTGSENDNTNSAGVSTYFSDLKAPLTSLKAVESVTATQDTLVGEFFDKDGNAGYVVTNFADPYYETADTVTMNLKGANRVLVAKNGVIEKYVVLENQFTITLNAGEGAFIVPVML